MTGPEEGAAGRGHLRAARTDREHVIDLLKAAFVQGRLTKDELDARAGQALTAQTYAQLAVLTADIPAGPLATRPPRQPARPQNRPKQTQLMRNAAMGSVSCLTVAFLAFWYGASLDDHNTPIFLFLTLVAVIAAAGLFGSGIVGVLQARRSHRQLPPRPGGAARAPKGGSRASPAMTRLPPVPAPTRPAPTCGPTGPGRTGRPRGARVSRCRTVCELARS
jgi:hypothetical protein